MIYQKDNLVHLENFEDLQAIMAIETKFKKQAKSNKKLFEKLIADYFANLPVFKEGNNN